MAPGASRIYGAKTNFQNKIQFGKNTPKPSMDQCEASLTGTTQTVLWLTRTNQKPHFFSIIIKTRDRDSTRSASARRREGDRFESRSDTAS